ncbi:MAG: M23 family metallopeptidase [Anaerolineae bacterium]|nr:M23 family metallopeptidase [Anaerolineae bacterium]
MFTGKGYFIASLPDAIEDVTALADLASLAGLGHLILKVAEGADELDNEANILTSKAISVLNEAGIVPIGWAPIYGQKVDLTSQANRVAAAVKHYGVKALVLRAMDLPGQRWGARPAAQFMKALQTALESEGVQDTLLALNSYGDMVNNSDFPYAEFMAVCHVALPEVDWALKSTNNPIQALQDAYNAYFSRFPNKDFVPSANITRQHLMVAGKDFTWEPRTGHINMFLNQADAMDYMGVSFWNWESAREMRNLWDAVARFPFDLVIPSLSESQGMGGGGTPAAMISDINVDDDGQATVYVGSEGYQQGVYENDTEGLTIFTRNGLTFAWTPRQDKTSTAYAQWLPKVTTTGEYVLEAYIPGVNATTRKARYHIHGVVGQDSTMVIELNQLSYSDVWARVGIFELDGGHPYSGMVSLNNLTVGEDTANAKVAFGPFRWRKLVRQAGIPEGYADGFDSPVGTEEERRSDQMWPGAWMDANPFLNLYELGYHTGTDHNLNSPRFDSDKGAPAYSIADGVVTYSGRAFNRDGSPSGFGTLVVIKHDPYLTDTGETIVAYSRYAHMKDLVPQKGERVKRGDRVGTIWNVGTGAHHLHFDISLSGILETHPGHWPGTRKKEVEKHYVDPAAFIRANRPRVR